jgi:hypothetical protein
MEGGAGLRARQQPEDRQDGHNGPPQQTPTRNIWRDGFWIVVLAMAIIGVGELYQIWLQFGPEGQAERAQLRGDGTHAASYEFDLTKLAPRVEASQIVAAGAHRDEIPVLTDPGHISIQENTGLTGYDKYVLPTDRVIGVEVGGHARAYPIQVMQVHQVANDVFANTSVVVVYDPFADAASANVALPAGESANTLSSQDPALTFGFSGLNYQGTALTYSHGNRRKAADSLWSGGVCVAGPLAGRSLQNVDSVEVLQWRDWLLEHPDTSIVKRNDNFKDQYKADTYRAYYQSDKLLYSIAPQLSEGQLSKLGLKRKSRGIGIFTHNGKHIFIPHESVLASARFDSGGLGVWDARSAELSATINCRKADVGFTPSTVWLKGEQPESPVVMLFAWYAQHPDTLVLQADATLAKP